MPQEKRLEDRRMNASAARGLLERPLLGLSLEAVNCGVALQVACARRWPIGRRAVLPMGHFLEASSASPPLRHPSSADQPHQDEDDREHQQDVNPPSQRGKADESDEPKNDEDHGDCPEHERFSFAMHDPICVHESRCDAEARGTVW